MTLTKAIIEVDRRDWDPSRILSPIFPVQFNPTEYTKAKGAQIAEIAIPGIDSPILQFIRGQNEKLTLDLFFDTTDLGMGALAVPVTTLTSQFYQLVKIQPKTHAPPRVTFIWGLGLSFKAIVESVTEKFTLFNPLGIPLRATLSVAFREYKTLEQQLKELNLQSADHSRQYSVVQGDTLPGIAWDQYRDASQWRLIADHNADRISNPRRLSPGTMLRIPQLDSAASTRGGA